MSVNFDEYSECYDLWYADKDYYSEVAYIKKLINVSASKKISSILELVRDWGSSLFNGFQ
jgi:hypothetical protein